jgi:hypothetical protein
MAITARLDEDFDHVAVLVDGTPEVLPLALDVHDEFVQVPGVTQPPFPRLQTASLLSADLPAPVADTLVGDGDSALRQ